MVVNYDLVHKVHKCKRPVDTHAVKGEKQGGVYALCMVFGPSKLLVLAQNGVWTRFGKWPAM